MKYLDKPCARCNSMTLGKPEKRGDKITCLCHTCGKRMGYRVIEKADPLKKSYELYVIGGMKPATVMRPHRLPLRHAKRSTQDVIYALDKIFPS